MRDGILNSLVRAAACILLVLMAGCASTGGEKPLPPPVQQPPIFPPQSVMQSGDYAAFLAENRDALKSCNEPEQCAAALLNMGFIHSYSKSPYFNTARGIQYLEDLIKGAPDSPWAFQARLWIDLMKKGVRKDVKKRPAKGDAKSKEAATAPAAGGEAPGQVEAPREGPMDNDRQQFEDEIRARDETIKELSRQLERSRQIDIEIERTQRRLPY